MLHMHLQECIVGPQLYFKWYITLQFVAVTGLALDADCSNVCDGGPHHTDDCDSCWWCSLHCKNCPRQRKPWHHDCKSVEFMGGWHSSIKLPYWYTTACAGSCVINYTVSAAFYIPWTTRLVSWAKYCTGIWSIDIYEQTTWAFFECAKLNSQSCLDRGINWCSDT